jgi:predicted branched-subunit amino acid permease
MSEASALRPTFTWRGFLAGTRASAVLMPTIVFYGFAFGIMAASKFLSALESMLFAGLVFAGGAQMATLEAWAEPIPILAVVLTTAAMNSRYLLMGAALRPWYARLPAWQSYGSLFFMGDANWAMAVREHRGGKPDAAFMVGTGLPIWFVWVAATFAGHALGSLLGDPKLLGIDFLLPAFFAALSVTFFRMGDSAALPLLTGVATAIVAERLIPGPWYILLGALAGSILVGLRHVPRT